MREFVERAYERANRILEENVEYCRMKGVRASCDVVAENPSKAILDYAGKTTWI